MYFWIATIGKWIFQDDSRTGWHSDVREAGEFNLIAIIIDACRAAPHFRQ
jgi:hypothetical protein